MIGVGKLIPYAEAGSGAVASQATVNPYYGYDGLRLLSEGSSPRDVVDQIVWSDPGREVRQCGIVDSHGFTAKWTGKLTPQWSGDLVGEQTVAQGNRLYGPETLEEAIRVFHECADRDLVERLLYAIEAGESTGADTAGAQSGAIYVVGQEDYPLWDLRVDHADDPAAALRALFEEFREQLAPVIRGLPTRSDPVGAAARETLGSAQPASR